jgi:3-isopropylmalate/(R)-2-methylmalate dehydratase small subunit
MKPVKAVAGVVAPLDRLDVDTDQIIPKQFLKRVERTGYGAFLFHGWRTLPDGTPDPDFVLNRPEYREARILVARRNFGCGSSREHAVWSIVQHGFGAVVAPSFADIFEANCYQSGLVPVRLRASEVETLMRRALERPGYQVHVDVDTQIVSADDGFEATFALDPFRKRCLLEGLDDIASTLEHEHAIAAYERAREGR